VKAGCAYEARQRESFHALANLLAYTLVTAYAESNARSQRERIREYDRRLVERDTMLLQVKGGLPLVPRRSLAAATRSGRPNGPAQDGREWLRHRTHHRNDAILLQAELRLIEPGRWPRGHSGRLRFPDHPGTRLRAPVRSPWPVPRMFEREGGQRCP
jgi:hypothetical protein